MLSSVSARIHVEGNPPLTMLTFGSSNNFCDLNDSSWIFLWCESPSSDPWWTLVSLTITLVCGAEWKAPGLPELGCVPPPAASALTVFWYNLPLINIAVFYSLHPYCWCPKCEITECILHNLILYGWMKLLVNCFILVLVFPSAPGCALCNI